MQYVYKITRVTRVVDGDTIDVDIDLGFKIVTHQRIRLLGVDAPETRTKDLEEKKRGFVAKEWLENMISQHWNELRLETRKTGKFGRYLGILWAGEVNINDEMLALGLAEVYDEK